MIRYLLPTLITLAIGPCAVQAPTHSRFCLDYRSAMKQRVFDGISRSENCVQWLNRGCLQWRSYQHGASLGPHGYAVFARIEDGDAALKSWIDRHAHMKLSALLETFNPVRPDYASVLLPRIGLAGDVVIAEQVICR